MQTILSVPVGSPISNGEQTVNGNLTIEGDVVINGHLTAISGNILVDLQTADKLITLNTPCSGAGVAGDGIAGIEIDRGSLPNTSLVWNESTQAWEMHYEGSADQTLMVRSDSVASGAIPFGNGSNGYKHNDSQIHWKNTVGSYYLGVGTNDPQAGFHSLRSGGSFTRLEEGSTVGATGNPTFIVGAGTANCQINSSRNHPIVFFTNNIYRGKLDTTGYVAFGQLGAGQLAAVENPLHIANGDDVDIVRTEGLCTSIMQKAYTGGALIHTEGNEASRYNSSDFNSSLSLGAGNNRYLTVISGGNVGIGTTTPSVSLQVQKNNECNVYITEEGGANLILQAQTNNCAVGTGTNHRLRLLAGGGTRQVIESDGKVGLGDITAKMQLDIQNRGGLDTQGVSETVWKNGVYYSGVDKWLATGPKASQIVQSDGGIQFWVSNNASTANSTVTDWGSTLILQSTGVVDLIKGQLKFPATQNASTDVNTLDDYEEGTQGGTNAFTPTLEFESAQSGTFTYIAQRGSYTKIGRMVFYQIYIQWGAKPSSGNLFKLAGLPFTSSASAKYPTGGIYSNVTTGTWTTSSPQMMFVADNQQKAIFYRKTTGSDAVYNQGDIPTAAYLEIQGMYFV